MDSAKPEKVTESLTIFQKKGVFSYGTDAVLLADFVSENVTAPGTKKMCDICSGNGIISLMLCDRHPGLQAVGIEINPEGRRTFRRKRKNKRSCRAVFGILP